jgi:hypothetical protein
VARGQTAVIASRGLVLDANILIRAALGKWVRFLLETYEDSVSFYTPDVWVGDAREYIPQLLAKRGGDPQTGLAVLQHSIWISSSSRGSEWPRGISRTGLLSQPL